MLLSNNIILITGGATGIGFALAERLIRHRNTIIICGRSEAALDHARKALPGLITRRCDLSDPADRMALVDWITEAFPGFNVLINNAGIQVARDLTEPLSNESVIEEIAVNLAVPVLLTSDLVPLMRRSRSPAVINVTSGLAFCPLSAVPVYCASKAALHAYTMSLRWQLRDLSIKVIEVAPPIVDTPLGGDANDRRGGQPVLSPAEFADEVIAQLAAGREEVLVGLSIGLRQKGEMLFDSINA